MFLCSGAYAIDNRFGLAYFPRVSSEDYKIEVMENQFKKIDEAFGLGTDFSEFDACLQETPGFCFNGLQVRMELAIPESDMTQMGYSIIRDGRRLNEVSDTIQLGDTIRANPPQEKPEIPERAFDWIAQAGSVDTPPIKILSQNEYWDVQRKLQAKQVARYPCAEWSGLRECKEGSVPVFKTETSAFPPTANKYAGEADKPAYVMPMAGGKKIGIQVLCSVTPSGYGGDSGCQTNGYGGVDCTPKTEGEFNFSAYSGLNCVFFVDKIITGSTAMEADWYSSIYLGGSQINKIFQVIPGNKKAPVAKFDCKEIEEGDQQFLECDGSASYDPGGEIIAYEWDNMQSAYYPQYNKPTYRRQIYSAQYPQNYSITLKVTDDEGFYGTLTKTLEIGGEPEYMLEAYYDYATQKALITLDCLGGGTGTALLDIDRENNKAEYVLAEIENQDIQCNHTTKIGPIQTHGNYRATAEIGGKKLEAHFTIDPREGE